MNFAGWMIMLLSVGGTTSFYFWCLRRVLRKSDAEEKLHGVLDTERRIEEEEEAKRHKAP